MTEKDRHIPQPIRDELLVEAMHRCCLCPQHEDVIDLHHIVSISEKGPNTKENLMVVCPTCHAKIHRIRGRYTPTQLKMYKERWVDLCAKGLPLDERLREAPGIMLDSLHNQTPPEPNFAGRVDMLKTITKWYKDPEVRIGALIGWGGVGKSALVRKWYDSLEEYKVRPDGIFWWGFHRNAYLEPFLNALLRYVSQGEIDPDIIKSTWDKIERIKECIHKRAYLIILDGLEQMQKSESGDEFGKMAHRECMELLHYLVDTTGAGLCLITTRYPLKDLDNWHDHSYKTLPLVDLNIADALAMLKKRGVKGSDEDLKKVIERYKGHALSLTSVAGFVARYYDGDITKAPKIKFVLSDKKRFVDVNRLLRKYADKMSESELVFLNIFSLFRKEVTEKEFAGVFRHKIQGTRFNQVLIEMKKLDFKDLLYGLVRWRLISYGETKKSYTMHPLIRAYFESTFDDKSKTLCHRRIYEYFGDRLTRWPHTLEEMEPLFEQVYHACAAGLYDQALRRISFRDADVLLANYIMLAELCAYQTYLSVIANFFPHGVFSKLPRVTKRADQAWLLNSAGLSLACIGHPRDAEQALRTSIRLFLRQNEPGAGVPYTNLSNLQRLTGRIQVALRSAKKAVESDERNGGSVDFAMYPKSLIAHLLRLAGRTKEAERLFGEVLKLQRKIGFGRSVGRSEVFNAEFLISTGEVAGALSLLTNTLYFSRSASLPDLASRCHRCLAAVERTWQNYRAAHTHLRQANELARKVAMPELEIEALLEYGRLYLETCKYKDAIHVAKDVLKLCERTGFLLYEPDAEVILGKASLAQKDFEQAKKFANSARSKAKKMGYKLAENDASALLKEIRSKMK